MIYMFEVTHYCFQMYLKILEINVLKYMNLVPIIFLSVPRLAWQPCLKNTEAKLELLTNNDILMVVEKGIRGGICHAIHRYSKVNNKYMSKIIIKTLNHHT